MLSKIKYALSAGMIGVLIIGGWFVYNTIQERNELIKEIENAQQDTEECVEDNKELKETIEEYEETVNQQEERQEKLERENDRLVKEREEKERELGETLERIREDDTGNSCEENMEWLKEQAIEINND